MNASLIKNRSVVWAGVILLAVGPAFAGLSGGRSEDAIKGPPPLRTAILADEKTGGEFDGALKAIGWSAEKFSGTAEGRRDLQKRFGDFDVVLVTPGIRQAFPGDALDAAAWRAFMEKGGAVVLTGVSCSNQVAWISLLGTNLALRVSSTDKEKWMRPRFKQVGWDCSPMPFPTRPVCVEKLDGSLPYLEYASREAGGSWRIVSDTEGGRLCAVQHPVGSGFLLVSTARFQGADFLENIQFRHFVASRELGNTVADAVAHNYGACVFAVPCP